MHKWPTRKVPKMGEIQDMYFTYKLDNPKESKYFNNWFFGRCNDHVDEIITLKEVSEEKAFSDENMLKCIYKDGTFYNQTTLTKVRENINKLL